MSRMEYWNGMLRCTGKTVREFLISEGFDVSDVEEHSDKDCNDILCDEFYEEYIPLKGIVYKVDATEDEYNVSMERVGNDYKISMSFYNGGTCLQELCQSTLETLPKFDSTLKLPSKAYITVDKHRHRGWLDEEVKEVHSIVSTKSGGQLCSTIEGAKSKLYRINKGYVVEFDLCNPRIVYTKE